MPRQLTKERHNPLHVQMEQDSQAPLKNRSRAPKQQLQEGLIDSKGSRKILKMVKQQQQELSGLPTPTNHSDEDSDENADVEYNDWNAGESRLELDIAEQELMQKFMGKTREKVNISDLIMKQLQQDTGKQVEEGEKADIEQVQSVGELNPKVIEVYSKYNSIIQGPLPKTFKIIPTLRDWEQVLYITNPEGWTPQALYQATRIFTSNLKAKMAQRFFSLILLERVRDDISETKKLNYHLYMAVKKSLYKPAAFFKGFLLPLCESGTCTLREAAILSSVLVKVSVPVLHSAAALLKLAEMEYTGPNSLFIRVLLDKKYALPFKVIDSLVFHFLRFKRDEREMPVLWHQSLLVFCQRYKQDITTDQKEALIDLMKHKSHGAVTPETRRELVNSTCRDQELTEMQE